MEFTFVVILINIISRDWKINNGILPPFVTLLHILAILLIVLTDNGISDYGISTLADGSVTYSGGWDTNSIDIVHTRFGIVTKNKLANLVVIVFCEENITDVFIALVREWPPFWALEKRCFLSLRCPLRESSFTNILSPVFVMSDRRWLQLITSFNICFRKDQFRIFLL